MIACIPTKGRPKTKTYKLFEDVGIKVFHFIEPQDIESYNVPNKISILENDKGVGYARNFILNYCRNNSIELCIMCDDDIDSFGEVVNGKTIKTDANVFFKMLPIIKKTPFELYGMSFRQFAWTEKIKYSINSKPITGIVIIKPQKINWNYNLTFKEDLIFQFETIKKGNGCLKFNHIFFNCPPVGTNKGGCYDGYKLRKDTEVINEICNKYVGFVNVVKKPKTYDIRWDFKKWASHHKRQVK